MSEFVIAKEVAEDEFNRWADSMDLRRKLEDESLNAESKEGLRTNRRIIMDALQLGRLVVDDAGQFVYTPVTGDNKSPITFFEPDGAAIMAIDSVGKTGTKEVTKSYAILAAITKQGIPRFSAMKNRDLTVCEAIQVLFLAK